MIDRVTRGEPSLRASIAFAAGTPIVPACAAGLVAAVLSAWLLRNGVHMTPDSWAYWQGSVSMLDGRGYSLFFEGIPITQWPPLYSMYLAGVQFLIGESGAALIASNVVLAAVATCGWLLVWWLPMRDGGLDAGTTRPYVGLVLAGYVAFFVAHHLDGVLAEGLRNAVLPFFFLSLWRAAVSQDARAFVGWSGVAAGLGAVLMLIHNASLAFVVAGAVVMAVAPQPSRSYRLCAAACINVIPIAAWLAVRTALGQTQSHPVGLHVASESPLAYAWQAVSGLAYLVGPTKFRLSLAVLAGIAAILAVAVGPARGRLGLPASPYWRLHAQLLFGLVAILVLWAQFSVTWVDDPLTGRFILFLPLIVVPALIRVVSAIRPSWIGVGLAALLALQPISRFAERQARTLEGYPYAVGPHDAIEAGHVGREPELRGRRRVLSPPLYPWIADSLASRRGARGQ